MAAAAATEEEEEEEANNPGEWADNMGDAVGSYIPCEWVFACVCTIWVRKKGGKEGRGKGRGLVFLSVMQSES